MIRVRTADVLPALQVDAEAAKHLDLTAEYCPLHVIEAHEAAEGWRVHWRASNALA